jgi:hypothetical protein
MGGQPARMNYVDMMEGAGLGDVLAPKEEFMKEHERLVELLSDKQGGSGKSNFIARLMAEQKYKHATGADKNLPYRPARGKNKSSNPTKGIYRKPVMDPEVDDTEMSQAIKFDYNKIANKNQVRSGTNPEAYGASPFIAHHFGLARSTQKPRETAAQTAARRGFRKDVEQRDEDMTASEKRATAREEYQQRRRGRRSGESILLPASEKRKARRKKAKE